MPHRRDQRHVFENIDAVRSESGAEFIKHLIQPPVDGLIGHDNGDRIDAARQMLKIDIIIVENFQNSSDKSTLTAHHVLV